MTNFKSFPLLKWVILCFSCVCLCACSGSNQKQAITQFDDAIKALDAKPAYHCLLSGSIIGGDEVLQSQQEFWVCEPDYLYSLRHPRLPEFFSGYLYVDGIPYTYNANTGPEEPFDIWLERETPFELRHPWGGIFADTSKETRLLSAKEENGNRVIQILRGEEALMDGLVFSPITLTMTLDAEQTVLSLHSLYTAVPKDDPEIIITYENTAEFLSYDSEEIRQVIHSQLK